MNYQGGKKRIGFLGIGWIGRHRLEAMDKAGGITVAAVSDPVPEFVDAAIQRAPGAKNCRSLDELLDQNLDGLVIATPSAMHAEQAISALERGVAVFCQKPIGRTSDETLRVVQAARKANRLLGIDLCYRFVRGMEKIKNSIQAGEIGDVYASELSFHNAYGPDKDWYYNPLESGGGCVIDLGIHLVDLALWTLDFPVVTRVSSRLYAGGKPLNGRKNRVEDYAAVQMDLDYGGTVHLACSWRLPAGCDCLINTTFYGTKGGLCLRNVKGSFYDFEAVRFAGTREEIISEPPDEWGGRAAAAWAARLAESRGYRQEIESIIQVAQVLDSIYGRTEPVQVKTPFLNSQAGKIESWRHL